MKPKNAGLLYWPLPPLHVMKCCHLTKQESQMTYCTAYMMTETCDWAKNLKSLPFIWTIFYLNWFTQNITYLLTLFNIHMSVAEWINIAQRWAKIYHAHWYQDCIWHNKIVVRHINIHIYMYICMYVCMYVCVKIECRKQRMMQKVFQIQEIFNSLIKRISVIKISWKSINMEMGYSTKCAVLKLIYGYCPSFQLFQQKNPCYRSLMKIHQHRAMIFNKKCSFEVSIGMLPLLSIISSKESLL